TLRAGAVYVPADATTPLPDLMLTVRSRSALVSLLLAAPLAAQQPQPSSGEPWRIIPLPQSSVVFARAGATRGEIGRQIRTRVRPRLVRRRRRRAPLLRPSRLTAHARRSGVARVDAEEPRALRPEPPPRSKSRAAQHRPRAHGGAGDDQPRAGRRGVARAGAH